MEALEIGSRCAAPGEVYLARPLAALRMRDRTGRPGWRLVTVAADDPLCGVLVRVFRACAKPHDLRLVLRDILREMDLVFADCAVPGTLQYCPRTCSAGHEA